MVFVLPFWSQSDALNWDSNYNYLARLIPALAERLPGWLWVLAWPQAGAGWRWQDDGMLRHPRVVKFGWPYDTAMRSSVLGFDPKRFGVLDDLYAPTIYWLHQAESGSQMMGGYRQSFNTSGRPFMVVQHHYIIHDSLPYPFEGLFPRLWQQVGGTIAADRVVLNSRHTRAMMLESFDRFLNADQMRAIGDKSVVLPFGLVDARLSEVAIGPDQGPVFVYNHRFESYKRPKVTGALFSKMRRDGVKFEVWATQYVDQHIGEFPVDRLVGDPDYDRYIANIAVPAINTTNSVHETFCISALDSVALGHLLVAPRAVTFPELVPPDYPYLFRNEVEQESMLRTIIADWPRAWAEWCPKLRAFARDTFGLDPYADAYATILAGDSRLDEVTPKAHVKAKLDRFFATLKPGTYALDTACRAYRKATGLQDQAAPNRRVLRDFVAAGATIVTLGDRVGLRWS